MSSGDALKLPTRRLQQVILAVLVDCPNQSCKQDNIIKKVLQKLGVRAMRGTPRRNFQKNVNLAIGVLKRSKKVEEYRSKNVRVRLV